MNYCQDKWQVEIFRYSSNKGWELFQQGRKPTTKKTKTSKTNAGGKGGNKTAAGNTLSNQSSSSNDNDYEPVTVSPRYGCVEVKQLRLRIHLFEKPNPKTNSQANHSHTYVNTNANRKREAHTTVVRRKDTILLSSQRGLGAVVLKFRNVDQCIAFSDRLVELNAEYVFSQTENKAEQQMTNRNKISQDLNKENTTTEENEMATRQSPSTREQNDIVRSYIVRLLHDRDFLDFVDKIEDSLESTPDCSQMLKALEYRRVSTNT